MRFDAPSRPRIVVEKLDAFEYAWDRYELGKCSIEELQDALREYETASLEHESPDASRQVMHEAYAAYLRMLAEPGPRS